MEVYIINKNGSVRISELVANATLDGEYRNCCRTLDLSILNSPWDKTIPKISIELGYNIKLVEGNTTLFYGVVWSKDKNTDTNTLEIGCKDFGIYLNKNSYSYKFNNIKPQDVVKKICNDFKIKVGNIATTSKSITRNFINCNLYDIIMSSYKLSNSGKYMAIFRGNKLDIIKKGEVYASKQILTGVNLISSSVSESLNEMVNRINVFNKDGKLIDTIENKNDIALYGILSEVYKQSDDSNYKTEAKSKLQGVDRKIKVTNFGDPTFITGKAVIVEEPYTKLKGKFYIDADTHTWDSNGIYKNSITLNFQNLWDEKESGSEVK